MDDCIIFINWVSSTKKKLFWKSFFKKEVIFGFKKISDCRDLRLSYLFLSELLQKRETLKTNFFLSKALPQQNDLFEKIFKSRKVWKSQVLTFFLPIEAIWSKATRKGVRKLWKFGNPWKIQCNGEVHDFYWKFCLKVLDRKTFLNSSNIWMKLFLIFFWRVVRKSLWSAVKKHLLMKVVWWFFWMKRPLKGNLEENSFSEYHLMRS